MRGEGSHTHARERTHQRREEGGTRGKREQERGKREQETLDLKSLQPLAIIPVCVGGCVDVYT